MHNLTGNYLLYGLCLLIFWSCSFEEQQEEDLPNVVLIMCDDLGWGDVGFNGNEIVHTPHLDNLATNGLIFNRFYAAAPVCSPTRASCITGRSPYRMGIHHANAGHLPPEEITLPELLQKKGYLTAHFGKWHLGTLTKDVRDANRGGRPGMEEHYSIPSHHGYDQYFCTESKVPTWDPMRKPLLFDSAQGESLRYGWKALANEKPFEAYGTFYWTGPGEQVKENLSGDNSRIIMDRVIDFVGSSNMEKPFFTTIWFHTPHLPLVTDTVHRKIYGERSLKEQLLYGSITGMDEQVGRLIAHLNQIDELSNTMIWFCSYNGPERDTPGSAGPFRERKRSLHEGGIRVPAFLYWPAIIEGEQTSSYPVFTSDYLPTILDFLEVTYPLPDRPLDGISVRSVIEGNGTLREHPMGFRFARHAFAWMTHRHKLISKDSLLSFELYDLLSDPQETNNIVNQHSEISSALQAQLNTWISSCTDSEYGADY